MILGHDIFYFADDAERKRFLDTPFRFCGKLTDPVSGARFLPSASSPKFEYEGRTYYFATKQTRKTFVAKPAMYKNPVRTM